MTVELTAELVVLDVNETLSGLSPLRKRFTDSGAPAYLLETWCAVTLRDGFALAAAGRSQPFPVVGAAVLRGVLSGLELRVRSTRRCRTCSAWPDAYDLPDVVGPDLPAVARELLSR